MMSVLPSQEGLLYLGCFLAALLLSALLTPCMRWIAVRFHILDRPWSDVKTHKKAVPYLGGVAVALGLTIALLGARFFTQFPTGTLHSLRGIFFGGSIVLALGLADDLKPKGLGFKSKFVFQIAAAVALVMFDIRIKFISPSWFAKVMTVVWIVGVINAVNIVDIMDGLASGLGAIASMAFLFISLPSEEIYVNFAAAALAGALLGFIPYNLSKRLKIFLGDTGSLLIGFMLAALSLGTSYSRVNNLGVFAPILILGLPLYDTFLVTTLRLQRGLSPFLGSRDHFALRLERHGFFREEILLMSYAISLSLCFAAYEVTTVQKYFAMAIYGATAVVAFALGAWLARIPID